MSIDRSLKTQGSLVRHRNVLTRDERIKMLLEQERFDQEKQSIFGLPKVAHRKAAVGAKTKKKDAEAGAEGAAAPGAAAPAAAAGKAPAGKAAPAAKGAAPAKAAPAAKDKKK